MGDYYIRAIDEGMKIRAFVARTSKMVEEARSIHNSSATASAALGRSLTAGVLMGAMLKNGSDSLTLMIEGSGPAGRILVVAKNKGRIKGEMSNPRADLPSRADGKLDVGGIVGKEGSLTVMMDLGLREPYIGQTALVSGEIAEDLANYYAISEQQASAVSLGVFVEKDLSIRSAGGYIIQLLPGIDDEDIEKLEKALANAGPISQLIDDGLSPEEILETILGEFNMEILEKESIEYTCDCSRERIEKAIKSLGKDEISAMINEDGKAEVLCHFCNTSYQFSKAELEEFLLDI